ncbi:hypothetical protein Plhal703r1_c71g0171311 [Plasmopara halstedii]
MKRRECAERSVIKEIGQHPSRRADPNYGSMAADWGCPGWPQSLRDQGCRCTYANVSLTRALTCLC